MIAAGTLICFTSHQDYEASPTVAVVRLTRDTDVKYALIMYRCDNPNASDVDFVNKLIENGNAEKIADIIELRLDGSHMSEYSMNEDIL
jgi:hypothetical protein